MTDPDRLAELRERRAFLLRSLDDLDAERAAGDLTDADYELLKNDYSHRAADVLREIESGEPAPVRTTSASGGGRLARTLVSVAVVAVIAIGAGVFVARSAGERKGTDGLTGSISSAVPSNSDAKVEALLQKGRDSLTSDPLVALQSFDEAAKLDPTQVEALAYGGWVLRIVAQSVDDATQKAELLDGALRRLDAAIAVDPRYPDARAFRGVLLLRDKNDAKAALSDFVALEQLNPAAEIEQLVASARQDAEDAVAQATG